MIDPHSQLVLCRVNRLDRTVDFSRETGSEAIRVLHLIETGGPGGAERIMVSLAAELGSEYRSEAGLIRDNWIGSALRARRVPVTMLRHDPHGSFATLGDLLRLIREKEVAILHTHEFFMNTLGLVASRLSGVPLVATVHGESYYPDRLRRRLAYRLVGRFAGQMVAVSEHIQRLLIEGIGIHPTRVRVVPNGVASHPVLPGAKLDEIRKGLGLDPQAKVVATVGSLYPVKGHRYLLEGAVEVIRRWPDVMFLIIGRGTCREDLQVQARRLGVADHFQFLGQREDVPRLLAISDAFALPSLSEGMPLALLEAMAGGVPAVATNVGGVAEVLENGKSGLLVPPGDSSALAKAILSLLEDEEQARSMGETARKVAENRYSLMHMVQAYETIYKMLIGGEQRWRSI